MGFLIYCIGFLVIGGITCIFKKNPSSRKVKNIRKKYVKNNKYI